MRNLQNPEQEDTSEMNADSTPDVRVETSSNCAHIVLLQQHGHFLSIARQVVVGPELSGRQDDLDRLGHDTITLHQVTPLE